MDFEIYAGPLSRYYAHDWMSVLDRAAAETGAVVRDLDDAAPPMSAREVEAAVTTWMAQLSAGLAPRAGEDVGWRDAADGAYASAQAGRVSYTALMAWTAYARYAEPRPYEPPRDLSADPAMTRALNAAEPPALLTQLNCQIWAPGAFSFSVVTRAPGGEVVTLCSTGALAEALSAFNAATWRADADTVAAWARRGPPVSGRLVEVSPGRFEARPAEAANPPVDTPFEHAAQYAFAVMADMTGFAIENDLPMLVIEQ